jgi:hypothetical protein
MRSVVRKAVRVLGCDVFSHLSEGTGPPLRIWSSTGSQA